MWLKVSNMYYKLYLVMQIYLSAQCVVLGHKANGLQYAFANSLVTRSSLVDFRTRVGKMRNKVSLTVNKP